MKTKTVIIMVALLCFATSISAQNVIEKQKAILIVWSWWNALALAFGAIGGQLLFLYIKRLKKKTIGIIEITLIGIAIVILMSLAILSTIPFNIKIVFMCIALGFMTISYGLTEANKLTKFELGSISGTGIITLGISILIRTIILY